MAHWLLEYLTATVSVSGAVRGGLAVSNGSRSSTMVGSLPVMVPTIRRLSSLRLIVGFFLPEMYVVDGDAASDFNCGKKCE